jgi:threonine synthase
MARFQAAVASGSFPFSVQASESHWVLDGGRTIGWELADQIADAAVKVDDLMVQVGGGALLASCAIGLIEAVQLGRLAHLPRVWAVQSVGCAPFDRAWKGLHHHGTPQVVLNDAQDRADQLMYPWENPQSVATGILDDLTYDWLGVVRALLETGGGSIVATENEIGQAQRLTGGQPIAVDPTGSAGLAGVLAACRRGQLAETGRAAVLLTGRSRTG